MTPEQRQWERWSPSDGVLCSRSARSGSALPERAAEEATVSKRASQRTSVAPAAAEVAELAGAVQRRQSVAPAQTPAAAAAPAGEAAPRTAVSMRGRRRRSSVSPISDSLTREVRRDDLPHRSACIPPPISCKGCCSALARAGRGFILLDRSCCKYGKLHADRRRQLSRKRARECMLYLHASSTAPTLQLSQD